MSVQFNEESNHTFIIEDVLSDEDENEYDNLEYQKDLVKDRSVTNEIMPKPIIKQPQQHQQQQQQIRVRQSQKKEISYDDILKTMNMRVKDGKLELIEPTPKEANYQVQVPYGRQVNQNSYIHNKYFKDYQEQEEVSQIPRRPLTPQEHRILMIKRQIEIQKQRQRISQIKSKKLLFSTDNINISNQGHSHDLNRLFKFVGK